MLTREVAHSAHCVSLGLWRVVEGLGLPVLSITLVHLHLHTLPCLCKQSKRPSLGARASADRHTSALQRCHCWLLCINWLRMCTGTLHSVGARPWCMAAGRQVVWRNQNGARLLLAAQSRAFVLCAPSEPGAAICVECCKTVGLFFVACPLPVWFQGYILWC